MKKRQKTAAALTAALLAAVVLNVSNKSITVTEITVESEKIPPEFDGFTIMQISDLHNAEFGAGQSDITEIINSEKPDAVAVTGDFIDSRRTDVDKALELIDGLDEGIPVYYSTGNHESRTDEFEALEKGLLDRGVTVLRGEKSVIEKDGSCISIIGVDDPSFGGRVSDVISSLIDGNYTILLAHRPELIDEYSQANLALCGHAHGGQIRLPFIGGVYAPGQGFFPEYAEGKRVIGGTCLIISRGLGNSLFPFRINNPPELVKITLTCGNNT